ncbi:ubiquinone biosynthesis protein coq9 [Aspergillus luchuensis]|uniref:Ubiquinone biosynthesis protein n=1 Tax=Aspergillus kawachii TaxID=1069201 RepID=A0A146FA02_ASPKA|nr:ubiquinone biosynthesis protein coq9 [Aspergillus luchuensis]
MTRSQPLLTLSRRYLTTAAPRTTTTTPIRTTTSLLTTKPTTTSLRTIQHQPCLRTTTPSIRPYHSIHHPSPPHEYSNSQTTILSSALRHVPTHGFTRDALTLGARDAGFLDVSVQLLPRGEFDLILFWLASRRGLLRSKALAIMSLGENIPLSLSELHALSDDILTLAGDASVDASWYSKRMAVAAVYASSEFVMTRDTSAGLRDTEEFLTRRWADARAVKDKVSGVKQCLGFLGSTAVGLGRSWGLKL